jgi:hypothetical protein
LSRPKGVLVETTVRCCGQNHKIGLAANGQLFLPHHPPEVRERELNYSLVGGAEERRCIEILQSVRRHREWGKSYTYSRVGFHEDIYYNTSNWLTLIMKYPIRRMAWRIADRLRRRRGLPLLPPADFSSAEKKPELLGNLFCTALLQEMKARGYKFDVVHSRPKKVKGHNEYGSLRDRHHFTIFAKVPEETESVLLDLSTKQKRGRFSYFLCNSDEDMLPSTPLKIKKGYVPVARLDVTFDLRVDRSKGASHTPVYRRTAVTGSLYYTDWCNGQVLKATKDVPMQRYADMIERAYIVLAYLTTRQKDLFREHKGSRIHRRRVARLAKLHEQEAN